MIDIEERVEKAKRLFKEGGYNCCQAVVLAYNDVFGIEDELAASLSSGFGGGMGRMREVCGAVSAVQMEYLFHKKPPVHMHLCVLYTRFPQNTIAPGKKCISPAAAIDGRFSGWYTEFSS